MNIRIGARASTLSKLQAISVGQALLAKNRKIKIDYFFKETQGDKNLDTPLVELSGQGVFTKELESELENKHIDVIVHSWKDLDLEPRPNSTVFSVLPRADQRDLILFKREIRSTAINSLKILTSSPRREFNLHLFLKEFLPSSLRKNEIQFQAVRGNIQTRLRKFMESDAHGIVIAKAAIDRLLSPILVKDHKDEFLSVSRTIREIVDQCLYMIVPLSLSPNAPAQGTICVQIRNAEPELESMLKAIQDPETEFTSVAERKILKEFGGGCHQKIGVACLKRPYGPIEFIRGESETGKSLKSMRIINDASEKFHISEIWPPDGKMAGRQRERLEYKIPKDSDFFVSRGYAYPLDLIIDSVTQVIWTAGLSTWKDISNRDVWVNGSSDGLGESERIDISTLLGRNLKFVKLSHLDSDTSFSSLPLISTYRVSAPEIPLHFDSTKIKAAFWRSGSEFEIITTKYPLLKDVIHFVGPGSTYLKIKKELGDRPNLKIFVCLSFEDWRNEHVFE